MLPLLLSIEGVCSKSVVDEGVCIESILFVDDGAACGCCRRRIIAVGVWEKISIFEKVFFSHGARPWSLKSETLP
jgi:hypothetical protein